MSEARAKKPERRSYHDVEVEFGGRRARLFDEPFNLQLQCTRVGGWELWQMESDPRSSMLLAGEYELDARKLTVYVAGVVICGEVPR